MILHRTPEHAPQLAEQQRIGAVELAAEGVIDRILPEPVPAAEEPGAFIRRTVSALREELAHATRLTPPGPRLARFRGLAR